MARASPAASPSRRTKPPPWVTVNRYLAREVSKGPLEAARGEATSYDAYDADTLTLLSLLRASDGAALRRVACIPNWRLCVFSRLVAPNQLLLRRSVDGRCPPAPRGLSIRADVRAGVIVTGLRMREAKLWLPARCRTALSECERGGTRFVCANFGLHRTTDLKDGHANALIFDLKRRVIERFDPAGMVRDGSDDRTIEGLFRRQLPGWGYVGTRAAAPARGVQERADAFAGLCVTYSLMYTLLRLLNPERTAHEVQLHLSRGSASDLRQRALRLNRFMLDTLRNHPRGSLRH